MANISTSSLFHFTSTLENLISILTNGFYPRYCLENFEFSDDVPALHAIPMVCFCDIPLSQIENHLNSYGRYGIGLTKSWGEKKRINPVMYIKNNSALNNCIDGLNNSSEKLYANILESSGKDTEDIIKIMLDHKTKKSTEQLSKLQNMLTLWSEPVYNFHQFLKYWLFIIRYLKPYEGYSFKDEKRQYRRFYDEREWRFIPIIPHRDIPEFLSKEEYHDHQILSANNSKLEERSLTFEPKDIRYIILNKNSEIHKTVDGLRKIYDSKFTSDQIDILTTKIITCESFLEDV